MPVPSCSLWIMAARTDLPFLMYNVPHLVRMCNFPFVERVLAIDTAPLSYTYAKRPGVGTLEDLRACCAQLQTMGVIDRVVDFNYDPKYRQQVYQKYFGSDVRRTHNFKGYPILGSFFCIEEAKGDYFLHFDSDMFLYQEPGYSWIEAGVQLLQEHPDVMAVRPLAGPPAPDGAINQVKTYEYDPAGFYRFQFFSSRAYLIDRRRWDQMLPMPLVWRAARNKLISQLPSNLRLAWHLLTDKGQLDSWEVIITAGLVRKNYVRAMMAAPQAWTLHPNIRNSDFFQSLPTIIQRIEAGDYPPEQAGAYDLLLPSWLPA